MLTLSAGLSTHVGLKRGNNEDSAYAGVEERLFVIADGMGGRPAGEVASAEAVAVVRRHVAAEIAADCTNGVTSSGASWSTR